MASEDPYFVEEKARLLAEAAVLHEVEWNDDLDEAVWGKKMDFMNHFSSASPRLRGDKDVALAAVRVEGQLLESCEEALQDDQVQPNIWALRFASPRLRNDKDFMLRAATLNGYALVHAGEGIRGDRRIVLAAVQSFGRTLQYSKDELRADQEIVEAAIKNDGWALQYVAASFADDPCLVAKALRSQPPIEDEELTNLVMYASENIRNDKDMILLAVRTAYTRMAAKAGYKEAHDDFKAAISWPQCRDAAASALACTGDSAPVVTATLSISPNDDKTVPGDIICEAILLSGTLFSCRFTPAPAPTAGPDSQAPGEGDLPKAACPGQVQAGIQVPTTTGSRSSGSSSEASDSELETGHSPFPTVNDLAQRLLIELAHLSDEAQEPERVFIILQDRALTPWDWNRPLTEFLPH